MFMEKTAELQSKLSVVIPKADQVLEAEAKNEELMRRVAQLETRIAGLESKPKVA
jgi:cell division protein FtsB